MDFGKESMMKRKTYGTRIGGMRHMAVLLSLVLVLSQMLWTVPAFASKYSEYGKVFIKDHTTNTYTSYDPLNIMVKGADIFPDTPAIAISGRTLIPVTAIFRELNVPYTWKQETQEIVFNYGGKNVVLQLGNPYATINGKRTYLPDGVAPRAMTYRSDTGEEIARTYVPVKFISTVLGLDANWIGDTQTVTINRPVQSLTGVRLYGARLSDNVKFPEIRLKVSGEVDATAFTISGADVGAQDKIVVDLQNTRFNVSDGSNIKNGIWTYDIEDDIFGLDKIDVQQTATNPYTTRVTVYQNERRGYDVSYDAARGEMVIRMINTVNSFTLKKMYGADTVVIDTSENPMFNVEIEGKKVYVDVIDSYLKIPDSTALAAAQGKIGSVDLRQLDTAAYGSDGLYTKDDVVTRITVHTTEPVTYDDVYVEAEGSKLFVYVSSVPINNFEYVKYSSEASALKISVFDTVTPDTVYDETTRQLIFEIPRHQTNLATFQNAVLDNMVKAIDVKEIGDNYRISVTLSENTKFEKKAEPNAVAFAFTNEAIQNSTFKQTLIVVDAGHGGKDPGAVGTKVQEKVLALKASKMLEEDLVKRGFKVYMTRTSDVYVNLYDRADMANDLNADLFVSIHINAHTNSKVSGVEVLYGDESMRRDKGLAREIQSRLVPALGTIDRGIVSKPRLVVVRETRMTSVLCELGFLSNASEQARLMDDAHLRRAATAIAEGIVSFLEK